MHRNAGERFSHSTSPTNIYRRLGYVSKTEKRPCLQRIILPSPSTCLEREGWGRKAGPNRTPTSTGASREKQPTEKLGLRRMYLTGPLYYSNFFHIVFLVTSAGSRLLVGQMEGSTASTQVRIAGGGWQLLPLASGRQHSHEETT